MLSFKASLSKIKKIEIISSIFSDHNALRLDFLPEKNLSKKYKNIDAKQYTTK